MQSVMDQTAREQQELRRVIAATSNANLEDEDDILKEVMKISSLEYQKQNGGIDLSKLKRDRPKQSEKPTNTLGFEIKEL